MKKEAGKGEGNNERLFGWGFLILAGLFIVIGMVFYVSLSIIKSGSILGIGNGAVAFSPGEGDDFSFGIKEGIFAVVFGLFMAGFLIWAKSIIIKNAYLGAIIGIIGSLMIGYGFYLQYRGPFSTGFMTATGLVVLIYIGMNFFSHKNQEVYDEEDD
ncbi:MAG: hypothetical protein Q7S27_07170 [Nanoarchaeota archaeon]|nr:hypothetical protein [Nanoarchaeota archaeon]